MGTQKRDFCGSYGCFLEEIIPKLSKEWSQLMEKGILSEFRAYMQEAGVVEIQSAMQKVIGDKDGDAS